MKKNYKLISLFSIMLMLIVPFTPTHSEATVYGTISSNADNADDTLLIVDTHQNSALPSRFRIIDKLNISGSAQFYPSQLKAMKEKINKNETYIIDLRQESHGMINDIAVSFYSPSKNLNAGLTTQEVLDKEKELFGKIKKGDELQLYSKSGLEKEKITVETVALEEEVVNSAGMKYKLFAVRDGDIPTPEVVDDFVDFIKNKPKEAHLHFHCKEGQGRTTTFMSLFQMMNNNENSSLEEILKQQLDAGGIVLTNQKTRAEFLNKFYDYCKENSKDGFKVPYSKWIKSKS